MTEVLNDGISIFWAVILSVIIWATGLATLWYYHFSEARRYSWQSGGLADFMDLIPDWLMNSVFFAWAIVGTFPLLNYKADKVQFGSVVGRAREMGFFDERPWYGVGGYQFLIIIVILIAGYLIHRYRD
ncbi:hypothetical protein NL493_25585 [Klebsiella pneumoniae]|nr:hypothetical protein [Klebsiella pneumoniae]